jgi:hypothetical protein
MEDQELQACAPARQCPFAGLRGCAATYIEVNYMKVAKGRWQEWLDLEQKYWKPMHEQRMKDGVMLSWMAVVPRFGGATDYDAATFNVYPSLKAIDEGNIETLHNRVHKSGDFAQRMAATEDVRTVVRSDLFAVLDQTR